MKILLGTNNAHKAREIQDMLPEHEILRPMDIGLELEVEENGKTFEEKLLRKTLRSRPGLLRKLPAW